MLQRQSENKHPPPLEMLLWQHVTSAQLRAACPAQKVNILLADKATHTWAVRPKQTHPLKASSCTPSITRTPGGYPGGDPRDAAGSPGSHGGAASPLGGSVGCRLLLTGKLAASCEASACAVCKSERVRKQRSRSFVSSTSERPARKQAWQLTEAAAWIQQSAIVVHTSWSVFDMT